MGFLTGLTQACLMVAPGTHSIVLPMGKDALINFLITHFIGGLDDSQSAMMVVWMILHGLVGKGWVFMPPYSCSSILFSRYFQNCCGGWPYY